MDGIEYVKIGEAFAAGRFGDGLTNVFSPGYPLFVGLFHLILPDGELSGRLVSVVFGVLLIWLSFVMGKRVLKDNDKALWLSFLTAFHPYLVRYSGQVLSESLATFLFGLTLFSFYVGWQENRRLLIALSGICLTSTYLTRPEYLIFYVPMILVLVSRRRVLDSVLLSLPFFVLSSLYVLYLHRQTGLWIVSNKALLSPFVSLSTFFTNIPFVTLCLLEAIAPLFLILAVVGVKKVNVPYRNLLLLLLLFHVLSLSFISHYTKRYSVEFVPLCLVIAAEGTYLTVAYLARFLNKRLVHSIMILVIVAVAVLQAYTPMRSDRALQKKAGLYLLSLGPGSTIAARLPIVAFYAKGKDIRLLSEMPRERTPEKLDQILAERRIKYLVVDEELEKELAFLPDYVSKRPIVLSLGDRFIFVRVYRMF